MLRYLYADQLIEHPLLARSMFLDRADQFDTRQDWEVDIDGTGEERDEYDALNPLYVIWELPDGNYGGSMRFLPTVTGTIVNDHFAHLLGDGTIVSPLIWECTRFCLNREAGSHVAAAFMLAGGELMLNFGIRHFIGVFDARMIRIYRMLGSSPEIIGTEGDGRDSISVGLWEFAPDAQAKIAKRANVSLELSRAWFESSFDQINSRHQCSKPGLQLCA